MLDLKYSDPTVHEWIMYIRSQKSKHACDKNSLYCIREVLVFAAEDENLVGLARPHAHPLAENLWGSPNK